MAHYLLIESRDPFEYGDPIQFADLAVDLAGAGNQVTMFLVQNGVLVARAGAAGGTLQKLAGEARITVLADEFSLRERGIWPEKLAGGVNYGSMDQFVDLLMADDVKAVWH